MVLVSALLALVACTTGDEPVGNQSSYQSIWSELYPQSLHRELSRDTLQGSFLYAAAAESQSAANNRWTAFLSAWAPADGEFDDAMQANLVSWAELEIERLRYLRQGRPSEMEAVSKRLRALAAEFE